MEIKNSCVSNFGGIVIENECITSENGDKYLLVIGIAGKTLFEGSPATFESMLESHQLLIDSCHQLLRGLNNGDRDEVRNGLTSAEFALKRADVI